MAQTISGTYTSNVTLTSNPVSITGAAKISGTSASAVGIKGPTGTSWTVTNQGSISESGGGGVGISLASAGTLTNITGGIISAGQDGVSLANGGVVSAQAGGTISGIIGVQISGAAVTVNNAGSISGNLTSGAAITMSGGGTVTNLAGGTLSGSYGVGAVSAAATVINAGSIGDGTSLPTGAAIALKHGGGITNQSGGQIVAGLQGIYGGGAVLTLVNAGTVAGGPSTGNGVILASGGLITNQSGGLISGKYGIRALAVAATVANYGSIGGAFTLASSGGVALSAGGSLNNHTGGTITGIKGAVLTGGTVVNAGSISGNATTTVGAGVQLSSGAGLTNQSGGTITGFNAVTAAAAATVVNAGSVGGNTATGSGVRLAAGGAITNQSGGTITAFTGILIAGAATVVNAGSIGGTTAVAFASGVTNRLVANPGAVFTGTVNGGNTIGGTSISTLELTSATAAGTLGGLGTQFINFAQTTIDSGAAWTLTGTNTLATGASLTNSGTLTDAGTLLNRGTVTSSQINLNGGTLTNAAGVQLSTYVYGVAPGGADTVVNLGTMTNTAAASVYLKGAGAVTNAAGGTITGLTDAVKLNGTAAAVSNLGQMTATRTTASAGVYLHNGGLLTNGQAGTGTSTASIQGYYGVTFKTLAGTLNNYGTVIGNGGKGVAFATAGGTLTNGASGATAALIRGTNHGVYTGAGAVTNFATINSTSTVTPTWGVEIVNAGTVANVGSSALIEGYGGVKIGTNGTVINAGTIESNQGAGGDAVHFTGGNARLIDDPGAVFTGSIYGGTGGTAVLELASAVSTGTISGLGTSVTNFTSLVFDTDAHWTVRGNDSANGLGGLAISGFAAGDTIDLTGFIAVNKTFAGNLLTVGDGVGDFETLAIQGTFSTSNFVLASDGSGGTDISIQTAPPPAISGTSAGQTVADNATLQPFSGVAVTDPNASQSETATITVTSGETPTDADGTLSGAGLTETSAGTYTLAAASPAALTTALAALVFTPTAHQVVPGGTVTTGFRLDVTDTLNETATDTTTSVVATAVNDPPVISGTAGSQAVGDNATLLPFSGVTITDPDFSASETVTITLTAGGSPSDADGTLSGTGLTKTGTGTYTLTTDTPSAVTTALDALVFTPTDHQVAPGGTIATGMTLSVTDGIIGSPVTDTATSVIATAVNDPPVISGAVAGQAVADNATLSPFTGVAIADPDFGATETVTITLTAGGSASDADGTLSGTGLTKTGTGTYTATGTPGAVTTALDALVFTPTDHQVAPGSAVTTGMTLAVTDGIIGSPVTDTTTSVVATALNDAPQITGADGSQQAVADNATLQPFSGVTITDPDYGATETVTITLTAGGSPSDADGTLSGTGLTKTGTGTYTLITDTPAAVTTALDALVFTPTDHQVAPGGTITTGMTLAVTDGIVESPTTDTTTSVLATAVNDPPVISGTAGGQAVGDNATLSPFSGVTITDPDVGATETVTITLTAGGSPSDADGTLSGTGLTKTGTGTYTLTTGTPGAVTTALDALVFTPADHQVAPGNTITTGMTLAVTDGIVGAPVTDTATSVIATAENDAPVISGTVGSQAVDDNVATLSPFTGVAISDPDAGATETVTITLTAGGSASDANGTLSGTGLTKTGTGTYTLTTGTPSAVSTELDQLLFIPTLHQVAPGGTVTTGMTLAVTDGIVGSPTTDTTTSVIATAVNDPPQITGVDGSEEAVADNATLQPFSGVTITDPDFGATETVTITVTAPETASDADGTLSGTGLTKTGTGTYTLSGTPSAVSTELDALVFTPTDHQIAPGGTILTGLTLSVTDGIVSFPTTNTITKVDTTAVNTPPVISGTVAGQAVADNATLSPFTGVTITDPDVGASETVTITLTAGGSASDADGTLSGTGLTRAGTGTYTLATGTPAAVSTELDQLLFTPTLHQVAPGGTITTGMTLSVTNSGGSAPVSTTNNTTTSVVATAVNDPPQITGVDGSQQAVADNATLHPFTGVTITDPDFGATETVTITLTALELPSDADGTLSGTGLTKTGTGTYSLSGTPSAVSTALDALLFTPTGQQVAPGGTITTGMTLSVTDGIVESPTTSTVMQVVATAVNDPPTITGTVADQAVEDDATLHPFSTVGISDPDVGATETVTITLTAGGSPSDADGGLSGTGLTKTGTGTYTLATGTPRAVTTDLNELVFTPTDHQVAPGGTITTGMTLAVTDGIIGSPVTDTTTSVIAAAAQVVPCFAAGTRIATARGAVAVERLCEGDMLLTVGGRQRPVQWIGRRVVDCRRHISPDRVKPIRIAAHAFGENRPARPLLLSPDHSVFVEDVLIPVKHLLNGTTITQIDVKTVTYYHVELPVHDVVLAEGLPAETYLETGGRCAFENGGGALQLHPDFVPDEARVGMVWQAFGYAPLIGSDGELDRVRGRLACQAVMLGYGDQTRLASKR
jgi:plastocyanin